MLLVLVSCTSPGADLCTDGRTNGLETDVDCGGTQCPACTTDKLCLFSTDCESARCVLNRCAPPSCSDGQRNGGETDVDCGGPCAPCAVTQSCAQPTDCQSGVCTAGVCTTSGCGNQLRDGAETDVDCGGGTCGACAAGKVCIRNTDCQTGGCVDGLCGDLCVAPFRACNNACVNTLFDRANCGDCGVVCPGLTSVCRSGTCALDCAGGSTNCGGVCVDTRSNPLHCGGCGQNCSPDAVCNNGVCSALCTPGQSLCGFACIPTARNAAHCGGCNNPCPAGAGCVDGGCIQGCPPPLQSCGAGTFCADVSNDPDHCGSCPNACPLLPNAPRTCSGGQCVLGVCLPGFADCNGLEPDGCEADLGLAANCGQCGRGCSGGEFCALGRCCNTLPNGTYQATCNNCEACEGLLTCICRDAAQNQVPASIPLNPPCPGGYTNCNGVLMCAGC